MNEKIKELRKQAIIEKIEHFSWGEPAITRRLDQEKFAELIVRECLSNIQNCDGDIDYAIYKIKKEFGIK